MRWGRRYQRWVGMHISCHRGRNFHSASTCPLWMLSRTQTLQDLQLPENSEWRNLRRSDEDFYRVNGKLNTFLTKTSSVKKNIAWFFSFFFELILARVIRSLLDERIKGENNQNNMAVYHYLLLLLLLLLSLWQYAGIHFKIYSYLSKALDSTQAV